MLQQPSNNESLPNDLLPSMQRRRLLKGVAAIMSSLAIPAGSLGIPVASASAQTAPKSAAQETEVNDWIWIAPSGHTIIGVSQCEVGQGIYTGLPQVLADEMDADWDSVSVRFVTARDAYRNDAGEEPLQQYTGASMSMTFFYERLRLAGAQARDVLLRAGAKRLNVRSSQCITKTGRVIHPATGRSVAYGEVVGDAIRLHINPHPRMKAPSEHTLIGKNIRRVDTPAKVDGSAIFGMDVKVPGMLLGAIRMAPSVTGSIRSIRNEAEVRARPGVKAIVRTTQWPMPAINTVIVVADTYWIAKQAADALDIDFEIGSAEHVSSALIHRQCTEALDANGAAVACNIGNTEAMLSAAPKGAVLSADYHTPYITHATMEPVVATVDVRAGEIEAWGPFQGQDFLRNALAKEYSLPPEKVTIHTVFLGGSFGRKYLPDFALHAATASKAVGRPVKVIRSREDDTRHSYFRPNAYGRFRAILDQHGMPAAMHVRIAGQSLYGVIKPDKMAAAGGWDETMVESIYDLIYRVPNLKVDTVEVKQPIPLSFLRSIGSTSSVFFLESFVNELAHAAGIDEYQYRRRLLADQPLALKVLDATAKAAQWEQPPAPGVFRGMAFNLYTGRGEGFLTYVALVAEVTVIDGQVKVTRAVCGIDAGRAVNPGLVRANIEGGIGFALTNTFKSQLTFEKGAVQESSFHDYPLLQMAEMPTVEVVILDSDRPPQGCGEIALGPTAPAVANAMFAATGKRYRAMPLPQTI